RSHVDPVRTGGLVPTRLRSAARLRRGDEVVPQGGQPGNANAQYNLGSMYVEGQEAPTDDLRVSDTLKYYLHDYRLGLLPVLSRTKERKMRAVRTGLLVAWFVLIGSLFWDPLTPALTNPDNLASPFRLAVKEVVVQGTPLLQEPYAMGNRIFWTMVLPLVPLFLMTFGHETWRRICPLSHFSQIPHMLGWQRQARCLNRRTGQLESTLVMLPSDSWLRRNHLYFQFGFLTVGLVGRLLFYNSDRLALALLFLFMLSFALIIGLLYGGKTWCNYLCPIAV